MKLLDFTEDEVWWYFRLGPIEERDFLRTNRDGPLHRWNIKLARLKGLIQPNDRQYFAYRDHLWAIPKSKRNRQVLVAIFSNAEQCIRILELSEKLPGFGG